METLDVQDVLDLIDTVVAERGEDHRSASLYVSHGLPMCVVGSALTVAGVSPLEMASWGAFTIDHVATSDRLKSVTLTPGAVAVLKAAQLAQDGGVGINTPLAPGRWGDARDAAHIAAIPFLKSIENPQTDQKLAHV